jgi:hypothetical protein
MTDKFNQAAAWELDGSKANAMAVYAPSPPLGEGVTNHFL